MKSLTPPDNACCRAGIAQTSSLVIGKVIASAHQKHYLFLIGPEVSSTALNQIAD